jgi:hypothetical protein
MTEMQMPEVQMTGTTGFNANMNSNSSLHHTGGRCGAAWVSRVCAN